MRIAVVSDIHGNLTALEAVLADLKQLSPDAVFHLGDLVANGSRPAEVFDTICDLGWRGIYGNTDEMLWNPEIIHILARQFPKRQKLREVLITEIGPIVRELLGEHRLSKLRTLPLELEEDFSYMCHASPKSVWVAPRDNDADDVFQEAFGHVAHSTIIYGHIHVPLMRKIGKKTIFNPGSVSLSYDGDVRASYLLLESGTANVPTGGIRHPARRETDPAKSPPKKDLVGRYAQIR